MNSMHENSAEQPAVFSPEKCKKHCSFRHRQQIDAVPADIGMLEARKLLFCILQLAALPNAVVHSENELCAQRSRTNLGLLTGYHTNCTTQPAPINYWDFAHSSFAWLVHLTVSLLANVRMTSPGRDGAHRAPADSDSEREGGSPNEFPGAPFTH